MILTYKYRLLPTKRQHTALARILEDQRQLYNAALQERIDFYRKTGSGRSYIDQAKALTECRRDLPEMAALPVNLQRWTLKRLDDAYTGFFSRVKRGGRAGFPRFRGKGWWTSFGFREFSGILFDGARLRFKGLPGGIRVHLHRPLPGSKPLSATFKRNGKGWSVSLAFEIAAAGKRVVSTMCGVDVGIKALAVTSDGLIIPNPRAARRADREMRRRSRALARCRRGSSRRRKVKARLAMLHRKIANNRATALHQASAMLVRQYDLIVVEALNVKGLARGMLARDVHDASWSKLIGFLRYKAGRAGAHLIEVDPRNTTQACSGCGVIFPKTLADRVHSCPECGLVLDRDHNAARNILRLGVLVQGLGNVARWGERRAGKLTLVSNRDSTIIS